MASEITARAPRDRAEPRRRIVWAALRSVASVVALVALYYLLPLDHASTAAAVSKLVVALLGFAVLVAVQVRSVLRSPYPGLRAVEAMAVSTPFFLLYFAATYVTLAAQSPRSFGVHLSHTDGLYFAMTVLSTVGFGDIVAKSQTARLVVTGQMLADLIVLGLVIKLVTGAFRRGRRLRRPPADARTREEGR